MLVVSNTSPILNLAIIDRLSLIREQFTTVIIPKGVLEELRVGENLPGSKKILEALDAKWLQVEEVQDSAMLRILKRELDSGEAEAITLALETRAQWVLLDESEARRIADETLLKFERRYWITSEQFFELYNKGLLDNGEYFEDFSE